MRKRPNRRTNNEVVRSSKPCTVVHCPLAIVHCPALSSHHRPTSSSREVTSNDGPTTWETPVSSLYDPDPRAVDYYIDPCLPMQVSASIVKHAGRLRVVLVIASCADFHSLFRHTHPEHGNNAGCSYLCTVAQTDSMARWNVCYSRTGVL